MTLLSDIKRSQVSLCNKFCKLPHYELFYYDVDFMTLNLEELKILLTWRFHNPCMVINNCTVCNFNKHKNTSDFIHKP